MGESFVRSPWSHERSGPAPERRIGTSALSAPRPDSHLVRSPGKGPCIRRDNSIPEPVSNT